MRHLVVIGDALLDRDVTGQVHRVAPDAPVPVLDEQTERARPGGAALAAVMAAGDGWQVTLVTALGGDDAGHLLTSLLTGAGVELVDLGLAGPTPQKVRLRAGGHPLLRLDRGAEPSEPGPLGPIGRELAATAHAVLVADYGRGLAGRHDVREVLRPSRRRPLVWDPHRKGPPPVAGADVVTPNRDELLAHAPQGATDLGGLVARSRSLRRQWGVRAVAATLGSRGAVLVDGDGPPLAVPAAPCDEPDPCGAGDRFATALVTGLAGGALPSEAVPEAVAAATRFLAEGGVTTLTDRLHREAGDAPAGRPETVGGPDGRSTHSPTGIDGLEAAEEVRRQGGVVVATGGCFDVLHAGHVALLDAARALGDHLVVCLNSDRSVRRLKGPSRPVVPAADRARVLRALEVVDAVVVFDEDTPVEALRRLRPHLFVKGGDYSGVSLPEAGVVAEWGGEAVTVPYLSGRSSTGILDRSPSPTLPLAR